MYALTIIKSQVIDDIVSIVTVAGRIFISARGSIDALRQHPVEIRGLASGSFFDGCDYLTHLIRLRSFTFIHGGSTMRCCETATHFQLTVGYFNSRTASRAASALTTPAPHSPRRSVVHKVGICLLQSNDDEDSNKMGFVRKNSRAVS